MSYLYWTSSSMEPSACADVAGLLQLQTEPRLVTKCCTAEALTTTTGTACYPQAPKHSEYGGSQRRPRLHVLCSRKGAVPVNVFSPRTEALRHWQQHWPEVFQRPVEGVAFRMRGAAMRLFNPRLTEKWAHYCSVGKAPALLSALLFCTRDTLCTETEVLLYRPVSLWLEYLTSAVDTTPIGFWG